MNETLMISLAVAIKLPTLTYIDSTLSILESLIVIATAIIELYILRKKIQRS